MSSPRPIIVVTGANSGVGFGVCQRLLVQLSQKFPPDAEPQFISLSPGKASQDDAPTESYDGLTLILACRSKKKALDARQRLLQKLDRHVAAERRRPGYDGHAERFRENLQINFHEVDMSSTRSVFKFCDELAQTYPYVSHVICNAGCAFWTGLDYLLAIKVIIFRGLTWSITLPPFKLQKTGLLSEDGLGLTWQSNLFGHYIMYRELKSVFARYAEQYSQPARFIWMGSLEGQPRWYNHDDWQLIKTDHSYEASKYEIDLIANKLNQRSLQPGGESNIVRHFLVHPGIVHSNMTQGMVSLLFDTLKVMLFYVARWLGSPNHTVSPFKSAVSATHIALVSLLAIPTSLLAFAQRRSTNNPPRSTWEDSLATLSLYENGMQTADEVKEVEERGEYVPLKFSSEVNRWGQPQVNVMPVLEWKKHEKEGDFLLEKCDGLYDAFTKLKSNAAPAGNGHANGNGHAA